MNEDTIILTGNRKQAILLALVSALFVVVICLTWKGEAFSYIGIAFFGLGFLVSLYMLLPGRVQLKIDPEGVEMKSMFKPMKLSWSDVDEFYVSYLRTGLSRTKMIGIKFSDSYESMKTGRKVAEGLTGMEGGLPDHFNRSAEEICDILNSYKRKYSER